VVAVPLSRRCARNGWAEAMSVGDAADHNDADQLICGFRCDGCDEGSDAGTEHRIEAAIVSSSRYASCASCASSRVTGGRRGMLQQRQRYGERRLTALYAAGSSSHHSHSHCASRLNMPDMLKMQGNCQPDSGPHKAIRGVAGLARSGGVCVHGLVVLCRLAS
jgi:hypothetical protein